MDFPNTRHVFPEWKKHTNPLNVSDVDCIKQSLLLCDLSRFDAYDPCPPTSRREPLSREIHWNLINHNTHQWITFTIQNDAEEWREWRGGNHTNTPQGARMDAEWVLSDTGVCRSPLLFVQPVLILKRNAILCTSMFTLYVQQVVRSSKNDMFRMNTIPQQSKQQLYLALFSELWWNGGHARPHKNTGYHRKSDKQKTVLYPPLKPSPTIKVLWKALISPNSSKSAHWCTKHLRFYIRLKRICF